MGHLYLNRKVFKSHTLKLLLATAVALWGWSCDSDSPTAPMLMADFAFSGKGGPSVKFVDQSTGGMISQWTWNFGDGTTRSIQDPTHIFSPATYPMEYRVSLTVCETELRPPRCDTEEKLITIDENDPPS